MPRKQPTLGFLWVLTDRLMMGLKVQNTPGHTLSSVSLRMGSAPLSPEIVKTEETEDHIRSSVGSFCVSEKKKKSTQKMWILNTLWHWCFANLISLLSFHIQILTNQASCFKCFDFYQHNPFQQNMVLSKHPQEDFMLSLISVAQLWKWDRKKEFAANLQLPGNCQDANSSTLKPLEWYYSLNDTVKVC